MSDKFLYASDHLGSIREITNNAGVIQADYFYDPYGQVTKLAGSGTESDFQYAGYYLHSRSGLNLTKYRAYNPNLARWISRDPIAELAGPNLFSYVMNNPISLTDPLGLKVYVMERPAFGPYMHSVIELAPDNPSDFAGNGLFANGQFATLGAEPQFNPPTLTNGYGKLVAHPNDKPDSPAACGNATLVPTPAGMTDTQFINSIIRSAQSYKNNLPYSPIPVGGTYNSNSYVSGVLGAAGATPPTLPGVQPGYLHPIPLLIKH